MSDRLVFLRVASGFRVTRAVRPNHARKLLRNHVIKVAYQLASRSF